MPGSGRGGGAARPVPRLLALASGGTPDASAHRARELAAAMRVDDALGVRPAIAGFLTGSRAGRAGSRRPAAIVLHRLREALRQRLDAARELGLQAARRGRHRVHPTVVGLFDESPSAARSAARGRRADHDDVDLARK
jgi:hypothetical protein